ncbi:MAG: sensor histidine kinase [Muribaculaceae bacterium]|nr:sensor histidine kinase [Muribaculaceae bacterium]
MMFQSDPAHRIHWPIYIRSALFVAIFYFNYYFILDRYFGRRHWLWYVTLWNLTIMVVSLVIIGWIWRSGECPHPIHTETFSMAIMRRISFLMRDFVMVALTVALSVAMKFSNWLTKARHKHQVLVNMRQEEELTNLKNQLNPHFLFNTLNCIYTLISISPERAQTAVHELSHMLRYVLYEDSPSVPLKDELTFINNYVKLVRMRIGDDFPVKLTLDAGNYGDLRIAPLLFISPVENAFKHGNTGSKDDFVNISIMCTDEGVVSCTISNHVNSSAMDKNLQTDHNPGIGNNNLQRRLKLIYGNKAECSAMCIGCVYTVKLTIHLEK